MILLSAAATLFVFGGVPFGANEALIHQKVASRLLEEHMPNGDIALSTNERIAGRDAKRTWLIPTENLMKARWYSTSMVIKPGAISFNNRLYARLSRIMALRPGLIVKTTPVPEGFNRNYGLLISLAACTLSSAICTCP